MKNESKKTRIGSGFWLLLTAIILVCVHSIDDDDDREVRQITKLESK